MAIYLAETITGLLQRVLTHPAKGLVNETNAALLTQKFWVQAIYTELLYASSRFRAVREKEQQRPPNGLVKVVCLPFDGAAEQKHGRKKATDARFETMIGPISWVDSLFIWFPAAWMPLVVDAIREKSYMHIESTRQLGAGGCPTYSLPVTNTLSHCCQLQSSPEPFILLPGPVLPGNKGKHWVGGGPTYLPVANTLSHCCQF